MTPIEEIERDLDWRESEMAVFRITLSNRIITQREKLVLYRAAWALLYAHLEGFCKFALTVYYDALVSAGKCCADLPEKTQAFALSGRLKQMREMPALDFIFTARNFEVNEMGKPIAFPEVEKASFPSTLERLKLDCNRLTPSAAVGTYA